MRLVEILNDKQATPETILETVKTALFEVSGDLPPSRMRHRLEAELGQDNVADALERLSAAPALVEEASLAWLALSQDDVTSRRAIEASLNAADRSLPLLEVGAATLVVLYAIYAFARIPRRHIHKIEHKGNGIYTESHEIVYDTFSAPLKGLISLVSQGKPDDAKGG